MFKLKPGKSEPELTLGEAFVPARDEKDKKRFCQPTDVAIMPNGDILVADGWEQVVWDNILNSDLLMYQRRLRW